MKNVILYFIFITAIHVGFSQSNKPETGLDTNNIIKVFPNPAANVINILGLENDRHASISITDTYGSQVIFHQWDITKNALNIPVINLKKGIYLITIQSEHQSVQAKFFKQ